METAIILQRWLPFGVRFFLRHPTKWDLLRRHWEEHLRMFENLTSLSRRSFEEVVAVFTEVDRDKMYRLVKEQTTQAGVDDLSVSPFSIVLYCFVRLVRPHVVVETGVEHGVSSWLMLLGMNRNGHGQLHSIDLPNQNTVVDPAGRRQLNRIPAGREPGWIIPEDLRGKWKLYLGDAKHLLPEVLATLGAIDVFLHDSLHSHEHMTFEYRTAWPYIQKGGFLLSDDVGWNTAFADFSKEIGCEPVCFREQVGQDFKGRLGAIRK